MKIKILLFPTLLVVIIAAIVWFVVPAYEGMQETKGKVDSTRSELQQIQAKNQKVRDLVSELDTNSEQEDLLRSYLPMLQMQEEAINSVNYLANDSQLLITNLDVSEERPKTKLLSEVQEELQTTDELLLGDIQSSEVVNKLLKKDPEFLNMNVDLSGSYENIKRMLSRLYHLDRFVTADVVVIEIPQVTAGGVDPNLLKATLTLTFNTLPEVSVKSQQNPLRLMTLSVLDFEVIDNIQNIIQDVPNVNFDGSGRLNPFVL